MVCARPPSLGRGRPKCGRFGATLEQFWPNSGRILPNSEELSPTSPMSQFQQSLARILPDFVDFRRIWARFRKKSACMR